MTTSEVLRAAKALIEKPEHWMQGGDYFTGDNTMCAIGALTFALTARRGNDAISTTEDSEAYRYLARAVGKQDYLHEWNDSHSHAEILAGFDKAIALAEQEQAR